MSEERVNSVPKKLLEARVHIKKSKVSKDGKNPFAHYEYFSPDQVINMVNEACAAVGIMSTFSLEKDDLGYYGKLITVDVESGDTLVSVMRTELPEIKATNAAQQMGGMMTYTKRYMLMNEYDIADNSADFDAQDNSGGGAKKVATPTKPNKLKRKKFDPVKEEPKAQRTQEEIVGEIAEVAKEIITPNKEFEEETIKVQVKDVTELDLLRAQCDELGIRYTDRHKESGLKKLIAEHESSSKSSAAFEGGEDAEDEPVAQEDPYSGEAEAHEEIVDSTPAEDIASMAIQEYLAKIDSYTDADILADEAKEIIADAKTIPLSNEDVEYLKREANKKYKELRANS